jgi:hypothetical protein
MYGRRYASTSSSITRAMARERQSGYQSMPEAYTLTLTDGSTVTGVVDLGRRWAGKEDFRSYYNALSAQQWATAAVFVSGHGDIAIRDIVKVS